MSSIVCSVPKTKWQRLAGSGLSLSGSEGQLSPVPAGREELSPLIQGGRSRCEENMEFFQEAQSAGLAGDVVAGLLLLQEVPGDGEVGALPPQLVDVPAEGGAWLVLVLLLHVICVPVVPFPEWASGQACVGFHGVVVAGVRGGDGGLVHHSWCLALSRQGAGWLVLAVAALFGGGGRPALGDHLGVVLRQHLRHIRHRSIAHFYSVCIEGASQNVARGEALGNDAHEDFRDVGRAVLGEGWVEPGDAALPVLPRCPPLLLLHPGLVGQLVGVAGCIDFPNELS